MISLNIFPNAIDFILPQNNSNLWSYTKLTPFYTKLTPLGIFLNFVTSLGGIKSC